MILMYVLLAPLAGATREEADSIRLKIKESNAKIGSLDISISVQKTALLDAEKQAKDAKENLRQVKKSEGKSWDFLPNIANAQKNLDASVQIINATRTEYLNLLKQKSDEIKNLKLLKEQLIKSELGVENSTISVKGKKIILIQLSAKCEDMIIHHYNTTCPSYKQLRYLDSSKTEISGQFNVTDGFYHRMPPIYKESWRYYDHDSTQRIIVDPPLGMSDRYPLILIESNFDIFLQAESKSMKQQFIVTNNTKSSDAWGKNSTYYGLKKMLPPISNIGERVYFHDRWVDAGCKNAIINSDNGTKLLLDTIKYMQSGCTETEFDNTIKVVKNYTEQHVETSQKFKHDKWVESVSTDLKINNDNSTNRSVTEDRMPKYMPKVHPPFEYP